MEESVKNFILLFTSVVYDELPSVLFGLLIVGMVAAIGYLQKRRASPKIDARATAEANAIDAPGPETQRLE